MKWNEFTESAPPPKQGREVLLWIIGGSAGSFNPVRTFLQNLPYHPEVALILCLHRLRNSRLSIADALKLPFPWQAIEPDDKTTIVGGHVYIAPPDYHLLVEEEGYLSLSVEEPVHFSRPSIDVLMESVAQARWPRAAGMLLSGANRDGALGMYMMKQAGYFTAVQEPQDAEIPTMPEAALALFEPHRRFRSDQMMELFLQALSL
ncbi:MAG: chemotaxis protein CheB [Bacteroidia bacterium]|nr:chemotaxis protein CheB [Bacteroidia bacterium]MDW8236027.1 chemotaxis protein CheB [Bacteroidia bacterium]